MPVARSSIADAAERDGAGDAGEAAASDDHGLEMVPLSCETKAALNRVAFLGQWAKRRCLPSSKQLPWPHGRHHIL